MKIARNDIPSIATGNNVSLIPANNADNTFDAGILVENMHTDEGVEAYY